jgi:hypothetical protein
MTQRSPTPEGILALQPQYLTPEQVADLVERARVRSIAAGSEDARHRARPRQRDRAGRWVSR